MNATRQDAWTGDEDIILAETVLRHIREGKTQLEAFKEVAKRLSRTSAACGFRWNATIRKQYQEAINTAKEERKQGGRNQNWYEDNSNIKQDKHTLDTAISLLEQMKMDCADTNNNLQIEKEKLLEHLKQENVRLKEQLQRYDEAWKEMGNLWSWVKNE